MAQVESGDLDLAVISNCPERPNIRYDELWSGIPVLVSSPALAKLLPTDPQECRVMMCKVPYVGCSDDMPVTRWLLRERFDVSLESLPAVVVPDLRAIVTAAIAGIGFAVVPRQLVDKQLESGLLVAHRPTRNAETPLPKTMYVAFRPGAPHAPRVEAVREILGRCVYADPARLASGV